MANRNYNPVKTSVLRKLYEKGLTLAEIGERVGMSKQAVQLRLINADVPRRRGGKPPLNDPDPDIVESLRRDERLTWQQITERLNTTYIKATQAVSDRAIPPLRHHAKKYPELDTLEVGESFTFTSSHRSLKVAYQCVYNAGKSRGMKLSVRTIGVDTLKVTRVW